MALLQRRTTRSLLSKSLHFDLWKQRAYPHKFDPARCWGEAIRRAASGCEPNGFFADQALKRRACKSGQGRIAAADRGNSVQARRPGLPRRPVPPLDPDKAFFARGNRNALGATFDDFLHRGHGFFDALERSSREILRLSTIDLHKICVRRSAYP
jgi:hypothetical protein